MSNRPVVRLVEISSEPLDVTEVINAVSDPTAGGLTFFVGQVRDHDGPHTRPDDARARRVEHLDYSEHPSARAKLREVAELVAGRHDVTAIAAVHRVGLLHIGDLAVVVAAAAVHRDEAFAAARDLIDTLKDTVPIWKHQVFSDGGDEWVGTP